MASYDLQRTAAPAALLSLAEIKSHLGITDNQHDAQLLQMRLASASRLDGVDGTLNRALMSQTWRLTLDAFPLPGVGLRLPLPPTQSIVDIKYDDADDAEQTVVSTNYQLSTRLGLTSLILTPAGSWPAAVSDNAGVVRITFLAGYGSMSDVPAAIHAASLLQVGWLWEHRDEFIDGSVAKNPVVENLTNPYKVDAFGLDVV